MMKRYLESLDDVCGASVGDFVPWLNIVSSVTKGVSGMDKNTDDAKKAAVDKALAEERARQEAARRKSRNTLIIALSAVGVVGAGVTTYLVARKK